MDRVLNEINPSQVIFLSLIELVALKVHHTFLVRSSWPPRQKVMCQIICLSGLFTRESNDDVTDEDDLAGDETFSSSRVSPGSY